MNYNIKIKADVSTQTTCGTQDCFSKNFTTCQPSMAKLTLVEGLTYQYDIIGKQAPYCKVTSQFLANPNPAWVGKTMTCLYDNTQPLDTAVADASRCSGPLYDLMMGKTQ